MLQIFDILRLDRELLQIRHSRGFSETTSFEYSLVLFLSEPPDIRLEKVIGVSAEIDESAHRDFALVRYGNDFDDSFALFERGEIARLERRFITQYFLKILGSALREGGGCRQAQQSTEGGDYRKIVNAGYHCSYSDLSQRGCPRLSFYPALRCRS